MCHRMYAYLFILKVFSMYMLVVGWIDGWMDGWKEGKILYAFQIMHSLGIAKEVLQ